MDTEVWCLTCDKSLGAAIQSNVDKHLKKFPDHKTYTEKNVFKNELTP